MADPNVALYWDFENVHASAIGLRYGPDYYTTSRYRVQESIVDVQAIMDYAATIGDIVINRAYNNWQYYSRYRDALLVHAIDLIQLFPKGANAKNGADIRLALDALQDVQNHPNVTHVVIVGGDSDFISLAQKLRQNGRSVIGIGVQGSTNRYWTQNCTEFKYYETITAAAEAENATKPQPTDSNPASQDLSVAQQLLVSPHSPDEAAILSALVALLS